jgi:hypothetical protein
MDNHDLWHWDVLDIGEGYETMSGIRYTAFFVICKTHYLALFLHSSKTEKTILQVSLMYWAQASEPNQAAGPPT